MDQGRNDTSHGTSVYRFVNRMLILVGGVLCALITVSYRFELGVCGLRALCGRECVLCGCTRDFFALLNGRTAFINPQSGLIFMLLFVQLCYRSLMSFLPAGKKVWICDAIVSGGILLVFGMANFEVLYAAASAS